MEDMMKAYEYHQRLIEERKVAGLGMPFPDEYWRLGGSVTSRYGHGQGTVEELINEAAKKGGSRFNKTLLRTVVAYQRYVYGDRRDTDIDTPVSVREIIEALRFGEEKCRGLIEMGIVGTNGDGEPTVGSLMRAVTGPRQELPRLIAEAAHNRQGSIEPTLVNMTDGMTRTTLEMVCDWTGVSLYLLDNPVRQYLNKTGIGVVPGITDGHLLVDADFLEAMRLRFIPRDKKGRPYYPEDDARFDSLIERMRSTPVQLGLAPKPAEVTRTEQAEASKAARKAPAQKKPKHPRNRKRAAVVTPQKRHGLWARLRFLFTGTLSH